jgi:hypothetical protein
LLSNGYKRAFLGREFGRAQLFQYVRHIDLFRRDDLQQEELEQALADRGKFFVHAHRKYQQATFLSKGSWCDSEQLHLGHPYRKTWEVHSFTRRQFRLFPQGFHPHAAGKLEVGRILVAAWQTTGAQLFRGGQLSKARNLRKRPCSYRVANPERLPRRIIRFRHRVTRHRSTNAGRSYRIWTA